MIHFSAEFLHSRVLMFFGCVIERPPLLTRSDLVSIINCERGTWMHGSYSELEPVAISLAWTLSFSALTLRLTAHPLQLTGSRVPMFPCTHALMFLIF